MIIVMAAAMPHELLQAEHGAFSFLCPLLYIDTKKAGISHKLSAGLEKIKLRGFGEKREHWRFLKFHRLNRVAGKVIEHREVTQLALLPRFCKAAPVSYYFEFRLQAHKKMKCNATLVHNQRVCAS
jgi:hypothetical protein